MEVWATSPAQKKILHPLLKLPTRGHSHVPNVGGGPHAEEVSKRRSKSWRLSAGELMHEVFAAVRIWQLDRVQKLRRHAQAIQVRAHLQVSSVE